VRHRVECGLTHSGFTLYGPSPVAEMQTENAAHDPHEVPTAVDDESVHDVHGRMVSVVLNCASSW
jgi:hypothetical protein